MKQNIDILRKAYEEVIESLKTDKDKRYFEEIFSSLLKIILETEKNPDIIYKAVIDDYMSEIKKISVLTPGISTCLRDEKYDITLNTYINKLSDIPKDKDIEENTVFDSSSMTKMFTSILLLKEEEKGNIDLRKNFSYYLKDMPSIDVKIIDALKFKSEIRTDGRIDEDNITKKQIIKRIRNSYVYKYDTFKYSDVPYMLIPLIYSALYDSQEKYMQIFYELYSSLDLNQTGYYKKNITGGIVDIDLKSEKETYIKNGPYDPKARILEKNGLISAHAGLATNITDLEKLFSHMCNNLLSQSQLTELITPSYSTLEKLRENNSICIINGKETKVDKAMGVFINTGKLGISKVGPFYSKTSFASQGSAGTYAVFDIENKLMSSIMSNIKSTTHSKYIMYQGKYYTQIGGTHSPKDGSLFNPFMTFGEATNNLKEESYKTLIKLRITKIFLTKIIELKKDEESLKRKEILKSTFNQKVIIKNNTVYFKKIK